MNATESSPSGRENRGSAVSTLNGVLPSCISKTFRHCSCRKRTSSFPKDHVMFLSFPSHSVAGFHDIGALSSTR